MNDTSLIIEVCFINYVMIAILEWSNMRFQLVLLYEQILIYLKSRWGWNATFATFKITVYENVYWTWIFVFPWKATHRCQTRFFLYSICFFSAWITFLSLAKKPQVLQVFQLSLAFYLWENIKHSAAALRRSLPRASCKRDVRVCASRWMKVTMVLSGIIHVLVLFARVLLIAHYLHTTILYTWRSLSLAISRSQQQKSWGL